MIQSLVKKSDLKKFGLTKALHEELDNILNCNEYIEVAIDKKLFINLKKPSSFGVVYIEDKEEAVFLKNVRDNYEEIKQSIKKKNLLNRILNNKIEDSNFFIKKIIDLKIKKENQLQNFYKKVTDVKDILQNVFIISEDKPVFVKNFDNIGSLFLFSSINEDVLDIIKNIKYANVLLFIDQQSVPYKKLKELNLKNLAANKESTKYIWHRTYK